jgi:hypothetical protein
MGWVEDLRGRVIGVASFFLTNDARLPSSPKLKILVVDNIGSS